jgi:hypothetical protein
MKAIRNLVHKSALEPFAMVPGVKVYQDNKERDKEAHHFDSVNIRVNSGLALGSGRRDGSTNNPQHPPNKGFRVRSGRSNWQGIPRLRCRLGLNVR